MGTGLRAEWEMWGRRLSKRSVAESPCEANGPVSSPERGAHGGRGVAG